MSGLAHRGQAASPKIGGLRLQTSLYSLPIPIVYGRGRLTGNLIQFPEPPAIQNGNKLARRSKGTQATARYFAPVLLALCEGPIASIGQVWSDLATGEDFLTIFVAKNGWEYRLGAAGQSPIDFMIANHPHAALAYQKLAYVAHPNLELPNGQLQNYSWEINGLLQVSADIIDAKASDVLVDYLTNADHGLMWPSSIIGDLTQWNDYLTAAGLFLSPVFDTQSDARSQLQELFDATNTAPYWSDGMLKAAPYGDVALTGNGATYTPNTTPLYDLTDDHFIAAQGEDPVKSTRKRPSECYNQIYVEFEDRAQLYSPNVAEAKIEADIALYGLRPAPKVQLRSIKDISTARLVAQLMLQRMNAIRSTYQFTVGWQFSALEPMDLVTLTDQNLGLDHTPVRITEIVEAQDEQGFQITAEQWPFGHASATRYGTAGATGYTSSQDVDPGSTFTPAIFEGPFPQLTTDLEIWLAASGGSTWGGCEVWVSTDNVNFYNVGRIIGKASYGVLSAALPAAPPLPAIDIADTLAVDLSSSGGSLTSGSATDVPALFTLCYVDGEYLSFETASLTAASKYNLTTLGRGAYSSTIPASHPVGSTFARCDENIFQYPFKQGVNGQTIYFKLPAFNIYGRALQDIATVPSFAHSISGKPDVSSRSITRVSYSESLDGTAREFKAWVGALVDTVHVHYRTVPIDTDPDTLFDFSDDADDAPGQLPPLRVGTDRTVTFSIDHPRREYQIAVRMVPIGAPPSFLEGPSWPVAIQAAPPAINAKLRPSRTGTTGALAIDVTWGPSDGPVHLDVYLASLGTETSILSADLSTPGTVDQSTYPSLGSLVLPEGKDSIELRIVLTDVAGQPWGFGPAFLARDPIADGTVTPKDFRANPTLVCAFTFGDTDSIKITLPSGKTKTLDATSLDAGSPITFNATDTLDDGSTDQPLDVGETRMGYKVEYLGGGTWRTIWSGDLHGQPKNPPTALIDVEPNSLGTAEDVYVTPNTATTEQLHAYFRDGDTDTALQWFACGGAADPSKLAVDAGTRIGPATYFMRVDGIGSPQNKLAAIALTEDQLARYGVMIEGAESGIQSPWLPVVLSLQAKPWDQSVAASYLATTGAIHVVIVPGPRALFQTVQIADNANFSSPTTQTVMSIPGTQLVLDFPLSLGQRNKTYYVRAIPNNLGSGLGLDGDAQTVTVQVGPVFDCQATATEPTLTMGRVTLTVTDNAGVLNRAANDGGAVGAFSWHVTKLGITTFETSTTAPGSGTTGSYTKDIAIDPLHPISVLCFAHLQDGSTLLIGAFTFDSNKISDLADSNSAVSGTSGANEDFTLQWDTDTLIGSGCARYSLDNGVTWAPVTVTAGLLSQFSIARTTSVQTMLVQAKNAIDGNWGNQSTLKVSAYVSEAPVVSAHFEQLTTSTGRVVWSCTAGTVTLSIDGGPPATPTASPIPITLDATAHSYLFTATQADLPLAVPVFIPALGASSDPLGGTFTALSNVLNTAGSPGTVDFAWNPSGFAAGVEYLVSVRDSQRFGDEVYHQYTTIAGGSYTYTSGGAISSNHADPTFVIGFYVEAIDGNTIGARSTECETTYNHP